LFAERHWPGADPIGRRFRTSPDGPWLTVVGVSDDLMHNWFLGQRRPTFYRPVAQDAGLEVTFVVRTVGDPLAVSGDLRRAIFAADPSQPIAVLASLEQVVADRTGGLTFIAKALTLVALIAFTLAMAGVYSLMAFMASQRTQEIGVRMALGASWWQVVRLTTAQALKIAIGGSAVGAALAYGVGQAIQSVLQGMVANRPVSLILLMLVLTAVTLAAAFLPARRAANLDPSSALRSE
jgi:predicted lysophospholipase L1 biosynthesis ABC-type transport system permease subunit